MRFVRPTLLAALLVAALAGLTGCGTSQPATDGTDAVDAGPDAPPIVDGMALPPDYRYPDRDTVRVATWNVEHFVDAFDDPYVDHPRENDPDPAIADRVDRFVTAIQTMNADVVVLQEVESEAYVQRLAEARFPEMNYRFFASTESPTWYMNVVVMSRFPLGVLHGFSDVVTPIVGQRTDDGARDAQSLTNHRLFMVDVRVRPATSWTVIGAHLKAGPGARNAGWRIGQIRFLHEHLADRLARRSTGPSGDRSRMPMLVAGDLNATADSPEIRLLLNDPARPAPDSLLDGTSAWAARFVDPLAGRDTPTHPSDAPERQLDYLLPNDALSARLVDGSASVVRPLGAEGQRRTSDHLPVVATFRLR